MPSSVEFVRHPKADKYHSPAVLEGRACQDLTTALTGSLDRCWKIASGWVARGYSRGESVASLHEFGRGCESVSSQEYLYSANLGVYFTSSASRMITGTEPRVGFPRTVSF